MKKSNQEIVDEFLKMTPLWIAALKPSKLKSCPVCGMIPSNMTKLAKAIEDIREEALEEGYAMGRDVGTRD